MDEKKACEKAFGDWDDKTNTCTLPRGVEEEINERVRRWEESPDERDYWERVTCRNYFMSKKIIEKMEERQHQMEITQINNLRIKYNKVYEKFQVISPDDRVLDEFTTVDKAKAYAERTLDFVAVRR